MARPLSILARLGVIFCLAVLVAACTDEDARRLRGFQPLSPKIIAEMQAKGMTKGSPILVRLYKQEAELEIWKKTSSGKFALLKTYPICRWSGQLGPKRTEGDRQVPEGFYNITASQLNPNSRFYLSYDIGYPNAYDRALGRSGGDIMVHGACSSRGCFSMTDQQMGEIYAITREAFAGGQTQFQAQSFPFRMTPANLAKHRLNPNMPFWKSLKIGADNFDLSRQPIDVGVCNAKYVFNGQGGEACGMSPSDASLAAQVKAKQVSDEAAVSALVAGGTPAVAQIYGDGGIHPTFESKLGSIPGRDRPYGNVRAPVLVSLDSSGRPATPAEVQKAIAATRDAAETLLAAEAAVARRAYTPDPAAIASRQKTVVARIFGEKVKLEAPVVATASVAAPAAAPAADEAVTAYAASPDSPPLPPTRDGAPAVAAGAPGAAPAAASGLPFYVRLFTGEPEPAAAAPAAPAAPAAKKAGVATASPEAPAPAAAETPPEKNSPFYMRWLGLGG